MKILNETDIRNIMKGAGLMGSGGGGSVKDGLILLEAFKVKHPDRKVELILADPAEMNADYAVGTAVMGAPSGGTDLDITACAVNAYDEISRIAGQIGHTIGYTLALELGGVNTFIPILVSLMKGIPMIDADCSGRAVPGLDTVLAALLGCPTAPIAMADIYNNRVNIMPADPCDVLMIEELALPVVSRFNQNAGIAGWMCDRTHVRSSMIQRSITLCMKLGEVITASKAGGYASAVFDVFKKRGLVKAVSLTKPSKIMNFKVKQQGGWDIGEFTIDNYHVIFSNESLLLYQLGDNGSEILIMSAPDIIALTDASNGEAVTNDDLQAIQEKGKLHELEAVLGIIKADDLWFKQEANVKQCWYKYFAGCGHHGEGSDYPEL